MSHQFVTGGSKYATHQTYEALFNWDQLSLSIISLELFLMQIVSKKQRTPFYDTVY